MRSRVAFTILLSWGTINYSSVGQVAPSLSATSDSTGTEMQQLIRALSGNWSIEFTINPTAALPKGGRGRGEEVWKSGPGGLSFMEEYHSAGDEGDITGYGIFWWDETLHRFQVLWCANDLPGGCAIMSEGASWEGDQLVLQNQWESGGKKHLVKEVFSDIASTSFTQTIYQGEVPEKLNVTYVFRAKKKSKPPTKSR